MKLTEKASRIRKLPNPYFTGTVEEGKTKIIFSSNGKSSLLIVHLLCSCVDERPIRYNIVNWRIGFYFCKTITCFDIPQPKISTTTTRQ